MTSKPGSRLKFGPGLLVAAAFIGPGTVATASKAGAMYGYTLLWAVAFSIFAAIVLQEMAARLGIVTGAGLSQAIHSSFKHPPVKWAMLSLILIAILFGNAAYQTGNLIGAAAGLEVLTGKSVATWTYIIAGIALVVIWIGRFDVLQCVLTVMVCSMSFLFVAAAVVCGPDLLQIVKGTFVPKTAAGAEWFAVGLIGTTVVPYNLFLHANAAATKWKLDQDPAPGEIERNVRHSFWDTLLSVGLGGVVTASILITAAVAFAGTDATLTGVKDIAIQLEPTLGAWAERVFAIGLLAAGLTSAITAPVAAGYATAGCFGWPAQLSDWRLKLVATAVVLVGAFCAIKFGSSPQQAIITAQAANGLLLPFLAVFLLFAVNRENIMGQLKNRTLQNIAGGIVVLISIVIATRQFDSVWKRIQTLLENN